MLMRTGAVLLTMGFLFFPFPFQKWNVSQTKIRIISTIIFILFGCVLFVALPAVIFKHIEGWNTLDAIYFVVITLTTIGFGDYVAGKIFLITLYLIMFCIVIFVLPFFFFSLALGQMYLSCGASLPVLSFIIHVMGPVLILVDVTVQRQEVGQ